MKAQLIGKNKKGFATLEILIAFTVVILSISAVIMVTFSNQSVAVDSQTNIEAISGAQAMLEQARATSRQDFDLVINIPVTSDGIYQKSLTIQTLNSDTKKATSTVTWNNGARKPAVNLVTLFTNFKNSRDTCNPTITGGWQNPQITTYEFGKDLLGDSLNIFPISAVDVFKGKLFVTVDNSSANNLPTFFEFNLSDPKTPALPASIDNASTVSAGLNAVAISDNYAYVANAYTGSASTCTEDDNCAQLQVIDIPSLKVVKNLKIPGITSGGKLAAGTNIFYYQGYLYLGLAKTASGSEFNIIDVSTPSNPIYKGGYRVGNTVNSIFVKNNYAYIATSNNENLTILDISNPSNPTRAGGYSFPSGPNGESVYAKGNTVYLGRTFGANEFNIFNATDPKNVYLIKSKDIGTGNQTSINSLFVRDYLAFMITKQKFEIWNIADTNNIFPWTLNSLESEFPALSGSGTAMDCEGNYMYIGSVNASDKGYLSIITSN